MAEAPPAVPTGRPVRIGMLRATGQPGALATAAAHAAVLQGAQLFFFTPADVDLAARSIRAWVYHNGAWERAEAGYPDVIENDEASRTATEVWAALAAAAPVTMHRLGGKLEVMQRIAAAGLFPALQIPTRVITRFDDFQGFLVQHRRVVTKPARGSQGAQVSFFELDEQGGCSANVEGVVQRLDGTGLRRFYDACIRGHNHLVQRYVASSTAGGLPFDIRLHVRRDHRAQWVTVKVYARIGAGRTITSNLSGGGSIASARSFLQGQFGPQGSAVWARLNELARDFPPRFQALYPDRRLDALGIDVGIDPDGQPWIFEVNSFPGARYFELDDAIPRVGYAIHVARQASEQPRSGAEGGFTPPLECPARRR